MPSVKPVKSIYNVADLILHFEEVIQLDQHRLASAETNNSALLVPFRQALVDRDRQALNFLFQLRAERVTQIATPYPLSDGLGASERAHPNHDLVTQIRARQVQPV